MLSAILAVILVVSDFVAVERAYVEWLGYRVVERRVLSAEHAALWDAPAAAGSRLTILQPASAAYTYLRLIERPTTAGFCAMATRGWNANEILVEDPAALERRFKSENSPFQVVDRTAPLGSNSSVIAMQAIGPGGELNCFTRIPPTGARSSRRRREAASTGRSSWSWLAPRWMRCGVFTLTHWACDRPSPTRPPSECCKTRCSCPGTNARSLRLCRFRRDF
jgi:hypothetical protein